MFRRMKCTCRAQEKLYPKLYRFSFALFYFSVVEVLNNWVYSSLREISMHTVDQ